MWCGWRYQNIATVVAIKTLGAAKELLRHERFDAIVLDINLPDGSGTELLWMYCIPTAGTPVVIFPHRTRAWHWLRGCRRR